MRRYLSIIVLLILAPMLRAQDVLPSQFGRWTAAGPARSLALAATDERSHVLGEAGIVRIQEREYSSGPAAVKLALYHFRDSSGAYEAFSYLFRPEMVQRSADTLFQVGKDRFFLSGSLLLIAENGNALAVEEMTDLARRLSATADKTPPPPIPNYLPGDGRIAGTEKYALGPVGFRAAAAYLEQPDFAALADHVGFNSGAETMFARYHTGKDDAVLLLIEYATPQLAEQHLRHLELALSPAAKQAGVTIKRRASLLSLVLGSSSPAYARNLRNNVNYETQVTWNEPTHTVMDPPILSTVAQILVGTGVFLVVAVVLGVAFGGVRIVVKMLFPGKVFDRPQSIEVLQLGLSSKKIDPSDFY